MISVVLSLIAWAIVLPFAVIFVLIMGMEWLRLPQKKTVRQPPGFTVEEITARVRSRW